MTFPSNIVQSKRFPFLLNGNIFLAYSASYNSYSLLKGPFVKSSKFLTSRPNRPRFRPENAPDIIAKTKINPISVNDIFEEDTFNSSIY